jgi:hypothetical protein
MGPNGYRAPLRGQSRRRGLGGFAQVCRRAFVIIVTGTLVRAARAAEPDENLAAALEAARALERWGSARGWLGPDPYDALNARWLPRITRRSPLALRVVTQAVKRSPLNLRPILGIPDGLSAATLAHVISAYARNGFLDAGEARAKLLPCLERLIALRCSAFPEPCWGYHFDVQTRVFFYPRTTPNTIATAFAGHAFLDAHERTGDTHWLDVARGVADFFLAHVPSTETSEGIFFGYLVGDRTPIHNANMLVCSLMARLAHRTESLELADLASAGVAYTIDHQRPDGSWPYGERPHLAWIDNFHTGYVLEALLNCRTAGITNRNLDAALERGLSFYRGELFREDGAPKYYPSSLYPIDVQCAAQGIQTFAIASRMDASYAEWARRVAGYALGHMRRDDGSFIFQRRRMWNNRTPHMRWCEAPMLHALSHLVGLQGDKRAPLVTESTRARADAFQP